MKPRLRPPPVRVVPFKAELGRAFSLEFYPGALLICDQAGTPVALLETPYSREHIRGLSFAQSRVNLDFMWIAHAELKTRALMRRGDRRWAFFTATGRPLKL